MRLYVETNFVLELALGHEQHGDCEQLIELGRSQAVTLAMPAFCLYEAYRANEGKSRRRNEVVNNLRKELSEFHRSHEFSELRETSDTLVSKLIHSIDRSERRLGAVAEELCRVAALLPLDTATIEHGLTVAPHLAELSRRRGLCVHRQGPRVRRQLFVLRDAKLEGLRRPRGP